MDERRLTPFGLALESARAALEDSLGARITNRLIAERIGIASTKYQWYLTRSLPDPEIFERLCALYALDTHAVSNLRRAYREERGDPFEVVPLPLACKASGDSDEAIGDNLRSRHAEEAIERAGLSATDAYHRGNVAQALREVSGSLKHVLEHGGSYPATIEFAFIAARIISQAGDHGRALRIMRSVRDRAAQSGEPVQSAQLAVFEAIYYNRHHMLSGTSAATRFQSALSEIRSLSGSDAPESTQTWKGIWNVAHRNVIIALTDTYGQDEIRYLRTIEQEYRRSSHTVDSGQSAAANELIRDRISTHLASADKAVQAIRERDLSGELIGERLFAARSLIVALHEAGNTKEALAEVEGWSRHCSSLGMSYKNVIFERLRHQLSTCG